MSVIMDGGACEATDKAEREAEEREGGTCHAVHGQTCWGDQEEENQP